LAILFGPFGFISPKTLNYLAFQYLILSIHDQDYSYAHALGTGHALHEDSWLIESSRQMGLK
jgi:hypothetical protein